MTTIGDLLRDPGRAGELSPAERDSLLRQLAGLVLVLSTVPTATAPGENGDTLLTVAEVCELTRQSREWVWRRARRADWRGFVVKPSRKVLLVREAGLQRWLARQAGR